jgi:ATP:ADP antiporter, AAA family
MQARLMSLLNIRPGEGRNVTLMLAHYFFMGAAMLLVQSASFALFFEAWDTTAMPYVYLGIAVIVSSVTALFLKISGQTSLARFLILCLLFIIIGTLILRIGLTLTISKWLLLALPIWSQTLVNLSVMAFWTLAGSLFDIRQGKRLFGLMNAGSWLAYVVIGPFTTPLVKLFGTENLYVAVAVCAFIAFLFQLALLRANPRVSAPIQSPHHKESTPTSVRSLFRKQYVVLIFTMVALWRVAYFVLDNIFYDRATLRFSDAAGLAGFIGTFFGAVGLLGFITDIFLTGRIISRFGLRAGLLITPALTILFTAALAVTGTLNRSLLMIPFMLAVAGKFSNEGLGFSLDQSGFAVLYQPIEEKERVRVQTMTEGIVQPMAIGLAGGLLLLFNTILKFNAIQLAYVYLVVAAAWVFVIVLIIRAYPIALTDALHKRRFGADGLSIVDMASYKILEDTLNSPHPNEVIYALDLLEQSGHPSFPEWITKLVSSGNPQVRLNVVQRIERLGLVKEVPAIKRQLQSESESDVREACARTLGFLIETDASLLESPDPSIQRGAFIGLLRGHEAENFQVVKKRLVGLAGSRSAQDRAEAANLIAESGKPALSDILFPLLGDLDQAVRLAALHAAGRIKHASLWSAVIPSLGFPATRSAAFSALVAGGELALPDIIQGITDQLLHRRIRLRLIRACGHIKGPAAINELKRLLDYPNTTLRSRVTVALHTCGFVAEEAFLPQIESQIQAEFRRAAWLLACLSDFEKSDGIETLTNALRYDLTETRSRLFYLFGFLHAPQTIHRARKALARKDTAHHAYATELMDLTLSSEHKAAFIPLMEDRSAKERLNNMGAAFTEHELSKAGRIMNILHTKLALESPWVIAVALEMAGQFGLPNRDQVLTGLLNSNETMVVRLIQRTETESTMLSTVERVIILKSLNMFATTPDEALAELADVLQEVEVLAGENIVEKGAEGDSLYVIVRGKVAVLDNERIFDELGERAVFGELSLLDSAPRTATVRALEDTTLLCLAQASYYDLMTDYVEVAMGTIQMLTRSLRARTSDVVELNRMLQG